MTTNYQCGQRVFAPDSTGAMRRCRVIRGLDQCGRHQLVVSGEGSHVGGIRKNDGRMRLGDALVIYARPDEMVPIDEVKA